MRAVGESQSPANPIKQRDTGSSRRGWLNKLDNLNGRIIDLEDNFMTNQEIFDKVVAHLRQQKVRSVEGNACMYRGPEGLKCAVGCLINDDAYSHDLEGKVAGAIEVRCALLASGVPADDGDTIDMLRRLQNVHDDMPCDRWEEYFKYFALHHNLTYTPL